jgi:hypothetical protein
LNLGFLTVGEAGNTLSLHQRRAPVSNVTEHTWGVTDEGNRLARIVEGLEQLDGILALCEVPRWPVAADVKHRVEIFRFHVGKFGRLGECLLRGRVFLEARLCGGLVVRQIAFGIDRGWPPLGEASVRSTPASLNTK